MFLLVARITLLMKSIGLNAQQVIEKEQETNDEGGLGEYIIK